MSAVGGNYISDGAIMAWLATQQDRVYGELKESMDLAERRADFSGKLVDIKAHLEEANRTKDFGAVNQELQSFLTEYGSDPEFAEICDSLEPMATKINADWTYASEGYQAAYQKYEQDLVKYNAKAAGQTVLDVKDSSVELEKPVPPNPPTTSYEDADLKTWTNQIDGKLDATGTNDQLTMIHIQQLKASIDQSNQLGSQWIAGGDKSLDQIIGNIS
jgi:hypothetical protein